MLLTQYRIVRRTPPGVVVIDVSAGPDTEAHEWAERLTALGFETVGRPMPAVAGDASGSRVLNAVVAGTTAA
ncbi:hypothetical protein POF50_021675 [Streptomyces sp. SL13]|uniref:Uncharacterized protein n=1 Tax=Streptantibioticus silvisoli TaxID=2705255 RepID=A0AA90H657_9ACTN|nr:hypothetical protein [Streptantibioticus silvisoli]MDI5971911.1 hypothetical protein [Streptantibioticus silvisoli]